MNISSIVVLCKPENEATLISHFNETDYCEFQLSSGDGKIILTVEADGVDGEISALKKIQKSPGVISAEMVYTYSEDELEAERDQLLNAEDTPSWLNEDIDASQIKYRGDLKKKF